MRCSKYLALGVLVGALISGCTGGTAAPATPGPTVAPTGSPTPAPTAAPASPTPLPTPVGTTSPTPTATATPTPSPTPADPAAIERFRPDLNFSQPVDLQFDAQGRAYVVEQRGTIQRFAPGQPASLFLDIRQRVLSGGEQGLLGLALAPDFASSGHFFVNYTAAGQRRTVIARFTAGADGADAASEAVVLEVAQPFSNHNAGALAFGPQDGFLYIPLGDGGSGGDPQGHGQNGQTLLGSVLRLDVSGVQQNPPAGQLNYRIPADNPFLGQAGVRDEAYARGFRNPFRSSFDSTPGGGTSFWLADVGQDAVEEVNRVEAGLNYGWNILEGERCFNPPVACSSAGLSPPVATYNHDVGQSVTGGYVYRGSRRPDLVGQYLYADFISGALFALPADLSGPARRLGSVAIATSSFGRDPAGEVYLVDYGGGLYRFAATSKGAQQ